MRLQSPAPVSLGAVCWCPRQQLVGDLGRWAYLGSLDAPTLLRPRTCALRGLALILLFSRFELSVFETERRSPHLRDWQAIINFLTCPNRRICLFARLPNLGDSNCES